MELIRAGSLQLIRSGGLRRGGIRRGGALASDWGDLLLGKVLANSIVSYEGQDPAVTGRYPLAPTVLDLDGVDQAVTSDSAVPAGSYKFSTWFKIDGSTGGYQYIVSFGPAFTNGFLRMNDGSRTLNFGNGVNLSATSAAITYGQWHFVEVESVAGVSGSITLDGNTTTDSSTTYSLSSATMYLGVYFNVSAGLNGSMSGATFESGGVPHLQYDLNHKSGTIAYDSSGNGNDGTLVNGASWVVDATLPPAADVANLVGVGRYLKRTLNTAHIRYPSFTTPIHKVSFELVAYEDITAATAPKTCVVDFDTASSVYEILLGSNTGLLVGEVLTLRVQSSSNVVSSTETITAGHHLIEMIYTDAWRFYVDGAAQTMLRNGGLSPINPTEIDFGASNTGNDGYLGGYRNLKLYDSSNDLVFHAGFEGVSDTTDKINSLTPSLSTGHDDLFIPLNGSLDIFGNTPTFTGSVYPTLPEVKGSYALQLEQIEFTTPFTITVGDIYEVTMKRTASTAYVLGGVGSNWLRLTTTEVEGYLGTTFQDHDLSIDTPAIGEWFDVKFEFKASTQVDVYFKLSGSDSFILVSSELWSSGFTTLSRTIIGRTAVAGGCQISEAKYTRGVSTLFHYTFGQGVGTHVPDKGGTNHGTLLNSTATVEGAGAYAGRIDGLANDSNRNNGFSYYNKFKGTLDNNRYVYTPTAQDAKDIEIRFWIPEDIVPSGSPAQNLGNFNGVVNRAEITIGASTTLWTDEVLTIVDPADNTRHALRNVTIPAGWNTLLFEHDGTAYALKLNGIEQVLTISGGAAFNMMPFTVWWVGVSRTYINAFAGIIGHMKAWNTSGELFFHVEPSTANGHSLTEIVGGIVPVATGSPSLLTRFPAQAAANPALGGSNRMLFDGVNDYVSFDLGTFNTSAFSVKGTFNLSFLDVANDLFSQAAGTGTGRAWVRVTANGSVTTFLGGAGSTVLAPSGTITVNNSHVVELVYTLSPDTLTLIVDGVSQTPVLRTVEESTGDFYVGTGHTAVAGQIFGTAYNATLNGSTYTGTGNTDADWLDTVGSNNGTVVGSPALLINPDPTLDVTGLPLTNPSVAPRPNDSESTEDCTNLTEGGTPTAATSDYPSAAEVMLFSYSRTDLKDGFVPNDTFFRRDKSSTEKDRLYTFDAPLTGSDLALLEKHTE